MLSALCCQISGTLAAQTPLQVMTFNIRYNNPDDSLNAWPHRKNKVAAEVLFLGAHLLGVQEALYDQMQDLQQQLPKYKSTGVGRDELPAISMPYHQTSLYR